MRPTVEALPVTGSGAGTGDLMGELTGLWLAARVESGLSPEAAARSNDDRVAEMLARPDVHAFAGRLEGEVVGFVVVSENPFGLSATPEMVVQQLYVVKSARRHGVARALLAAALGLAERAGCEVVATNVPTQSRDANRFFARLGFGSVTVHRVVGTSALRRRLAPESTESAFEVLRRRRSNRRAVAAAARTHPSSA